MDTILIMLAVLLAFLFIFFIINLLVEMTKNTFTNKDKIEKEKYYTLFISKINFYLKEINTLKHEVKNETIKNDINDSIFFLRMIAMDMDKDIVILNFFKELEEFHLSYYTNILKNYCIMQKEENFEEMDRIAAMLHKYVSIFSKFSKELDGEKALEQLEMLKGHF